MSEAKFTKGPYSKRRVGKYGFHIDAGRFGSVAWIEGNDAEVEATADLFSAAFEMYEALKALHPAHDFQQECSICTVIWKAEGRA